MQAYAASSCGSGGCALTRLWARARHFVETEGVRGLLAGVLRHLDTLRRRVFRNERYVIYEFDTAVSGTLTPRPEIDGLEVAVLERDEDLERLLEHGFRFPPLDPSFRREWLRRGGVAACAFVHRELAHVGWIALSPEARGCCDGLPYHVDFEHGEACWGGAYTWPRFRGRGLHEYQCGTRLQYMSDHGFNRCRDAVRVGNTPSLRGQSWWRPTPCLSGHFIRLLNWTRWREEPYGGTVS